MNQKVVKPVKLHRDVIGCVYIHQLYMFAALTILNALHWSQSSCKAPLPQQSVKLLNGGCEAELQNAQC